MEEWMEREREREREAPARKRGLSRRHANKTRALSLAASKRLWRGCCFCGLNARPLARLENTNPDVEKCPLF